MLGAFFSPPYRDWWLSVVEFPASVMAAQSHWLVRSSAAKEFNKGYVKLNRLQPSTTEVICLHPIHAGSYHAEYLLQYEVSHVLLGPETPISVYGRFPLLGDHSRSGIMKVDPRFIGTQARLCRSVRLLRLARTASFMRSSRTPSSTSVRTTALSGTGQYSARRVHDSMSSRFFVLLFSLWRFVPSSIRITSYKLLQSLGTFLYGCSNEYTIVQRLPFGLYLKSQSEPDAARNEFNALQLVRKYTSIPAPQALDLVIKPAPRHDAFASPETYLIMTRLPGHPLSQCQEVLSDADCEQVIAQLREYTAEIRNIPKKVNSEMAICNSLGEACRDPRVRGGDAVGPFSDESAFSQTLRYSDDPSRRGHEIVYTHADLNPRNILVDKFRGPDGSWSWRVTGIVDWESSGYYPEYWEYTKAMFEGFRWTRRYNKLVTAVFERYGDYCRELEIERRSWESGDGI